MLGLEPSGDITDRRGPAVTHLFGLLFPSLLLAEELQVELFLLLLVIFLQLGEQERAVPGAARSKPSLALQPRQGSSVNRERQGERPNLMSQSVCVGDQEADVPVLQPAPPEF